MECCGHLKQCNSILHNINYSTFIYNRHFNQNLHKSGVKRFYVILYIIIDITSIDLYRNQLCKSDLFIYI